MELPVQMATDRVCLASGIVFCYCDPRAIRRQLAEWNCLVQYPVHGQDQNFNKQKKKTNFYSYLTDRHAAYFSLHWMSNMTKRDKVKRDKVEKYFYLQGRSRVLILRVCFFGTNYWYCSCLCSKRFPAHFPPSAISKSIRSDPNIVSNILSK